MPPSVWQILRRHLRFPAPKIHRLSGYIYLVLSDLQAESQGPRKQRAQILGQRETAHRGVWSRNNARSHRQWRELALWLTESWTRQPVSDGQHLLATNEPVGGPFWQSYSDAA